MLSTWNRREVAFASGLAVIVAITTFALATNLGILPGSGANAVAPADSAAAAPKEEPTSLPKWATSNFPTSNAGLTYGSDSESETEADAPDLIAVVGDNGVQGFVTKKDFYGPEINTPEDAAEWERYLAENGAPVIPVYDLDGNRVDRLTLQLGEVGTTEE